MSQDVSEQGNCASSDLHTWLTLSLLPGFGLLSCQKLCSETTFNPAQLFNYSSQHLRDFGFSSQQCQFIQQGVPETLSRVKQWLQAADTHNVITLSDRAYPALLKQTAAPPMMLFVIGAAAILNNLQLAVVGSRNPSHAGKLITQSLAAELCGNGWTVTSGLALGIDACAHRGALDAGGKTVAVLGCGVDVIYPKRHAQLYQQIIRQGGCIVSEFLPGTAVRADHFPRRNRVVSGLSKGVLVVEAAIKSGSLITARYALEQSREVFAVPGSIHNPVAAGCHYLIKQGAKLVEGIDDINEEFSDLNVSAQNIPAKKIQKSDVDSLASDRLLDSVDYEVTALDRVAERSGLPVSEVLVQLLEYELRGLVAAVPGGYVKLGEN